MKKPLKAFLLSALVFPGVGHFVLKRYATGAVIASTVAVALYILLSNAVEIALKVGDKIQNGEIDLMAISVSSLVQLESTTSQPAIIQYATYTIALCWLIAIIDIYRVTRNTKQDTKSNRS